MGQTLRLDPDKIKQGPASQREHIFKVIAEYLRTVLEQTLPDQPVNVHQMEGTHSAPTGLISQEELDRFINQELPKL